MIVIEFFGLPGAGKSTICDSLEARLSQRGLSVSNLHKREKADTFRKKVNKLFYVIRYWTWAGNRRLKKALCVFSKQGYNDAYKWIDRILELNYLISYNEERHSIALLDEGFIQMISSICFDKPYLTDSRLMQIIDSITIHHDYYLVCCEISPAEALLRVSTRNRKNDRYNRNETEALTLLEIKSKNLEQIAGGLCNAEKIKVLSGNERPIQNIADELQMYFREKGLL